MKYKLNPEALNEKGFNLQSVFNIDQLPIDLISILEKSISNLSEFNQLIVIGHGGAKLWNSMDQNDFEHSDPIDDFSIKNVTEFFETDPQIKKIKFLYPGKTIIPLQSLGKLAGWHQPSLFRIGINQKWGTWFAYRAVILTKSNYEPTTPIKEISPCNTCISKPCVSTCPVNAVTEEEFEFKKCFKYRQHSKSKCKDRCIARISCPVAMSARYPEEQIKYHYGRSLKSIKNM